MAITHLEAQLKENLNQALDNKEFIFPEVFLYLMEHYREKLTSREALFIAADIKKIIVDYHLDLGLLAMDDFGFDSFKKMIRAEKDAIKEIKKVLYNIEH